MYLCRPNYSVFALEKLDLYKIDLKNMRNDLCEYKFSLDNQFFTDIEAPEIQKGNLEVELKVKKSVGAFSLNFSIKGEVTVACDRCLDDMVLPVETEGALKVKLGDDYSENDDLITVPEMEGFINVAWNIYEFIVLSLPMTHVHADGECNEEMMKALESHLAYRADEDENDADDEPSDEIDPRWNELKKILNNN